MNFRLLRLFPVLLVVMLGMLLMLIELALQHVPELAFLRRLEWSSYDWRVQHSMRFQQPRSDRMGSVYVDDISLADISRKLKLQWPFPRWVHGLVLKELTDQGAAAVAYDVFFIGHRPGDLTPLSLSSERISSDEYFAREIARQGHIVLAAAEDPLHPRTDLKRPDPLFGKPAAAVGHGLRLTDADGVLRRVKPVFVDDQKRRTWQLGLTLAARQKGLNLDKAELDAWRIRVPDKKGLMHEIPLDGHGNLLVRWIWDVNRTAGPEHSSMSTILGALNYRAKHGALPVDFMKDRLIVVGSKGMNSPIADWGATPAGPSTPFFSVHMNVANSVLTDAFVRVLNLPARVAILWLFVTVVGLLTWRLRAVWATLLVGIFIFIYLALAWWAYVKHGWWLPLVMPVIGALCISHGLMVVFRFFMERSQRKRLRGLFANLVSPKLLDLLLQHPHVSWKPQERYMTVFFADIRGFTALTDQSSVRSREGDGGKIDTTSPESAVLVTVNLYLSAVVEAIKRNGGVLDKYMGDCVMAFWGAPLDDPDHAASALRAAMEAQQAIHQLNRKRAAWNLEIERQNESNANKALSAQTALPILTLGTGINTGLMTAGFMGAESHLSNFTVFGREVNIASRLEGASGSGHIYITEETRQAAVARSAELANHVKLVGNLTLKGIGDPVLVHEVEWNGSTQAEA
jgi:adenylate cyclase